MALASLQILQFLPTPTSSPGTFMYKSPLPSPCMNAVPTFTWSNSNVIWARTVSSESKWISSQRHMSHHSPGQRLTDTSSNQPTIDVSTHAEQPWEPFILHIHLMVSIFFPSAQRKKIHVWFSYVLIMQLQFQPANSLHPCSSSPYKRRVECWMLDEQE